MDTMRNKTHLEIYEHLKNLQDHVNTFYGQALTQGKENEFEIHLDNIRNSVKDFIAFRDSMYR